MENVWVNVTCFFLPFSPVSLTESCSFWCGLKDLFTLHKVVDKVVLTIYDDLENLKMPAKDTMDNTTLNIMYLFSFTRQMLW